MHSTTTIPATVSYAALLYVCSPIVSPVLAHAGEMLAWYPGRDVAVLRLDREDWRWHVMRSLGHDDAPALARLVADRVLIPHRSEDATALRQLLPRPTRRRRAPVTHVPLTLHQTPAGVGA